MKYKIGDKVMAGKDKNIYTIIDIEKFNKYTLREWPKSDGHRYFLSNIEQYWTSCHLKLANSQTIKAKLGVK